MLEFYVIANEYEEDHMYNVETGEYTSSLTNTCLFPTHSTARQYLNSEDFCQESHYCGVYKIIIHRYDGVGIEWSMSQRPDNWD